MCLFWMHRIAGPSLNSENDKVNEFNTGRADRYDPPLHGSWQVTFPSDFSNKKAGRRKRLQSAQAWAQFTFLPPELSTSVFYLCPPSQQRPTSHGSKGQRAVPLDDFFILHFIYYPVSHSHRISNYNSHLVSQV